MCDLWLYIHITWRHLKLLKKVWSAFDGSGAFPQGIGIWISLRSPTSLAWSKIEEPYGICLTFALEAEIEEGTCFGYLVKYLNG